jgi:uncharacterized membrane protein
MAVLLGVFVAMSFGSADFLGGRASRTAPTLTVLFVGQVVAAAGAGHAWSADVGAATSRGGPAPPTSGSVCCTGARLGRMSVVAPVTVVAAIMPIAGRAARRAAVHRDLDRHRFAVGAGARRPQPDDGARGRTSGAVLLAVTAGVAFGASLVLYAKTRDESGFWPVLSARTAAILLVGLGVAVVALRGGLHWPTGHARKLALGAGALDVTATVLLLVAVREGLTVVVAPVAALAPAFTVMWAWVVLREHVTRHQVIGLAVAFVGLALIAAG